MIEPAAESVFAKSRELVLHYIVEDRARRHPGKPCLVLDDQTLTYAQVDREANRCKLDALMVPVNAVYRCRPCIVVMVEFPLRRPVRPKD